LSELKSLNLESNDLHAGGVGPISSLEKLQNLSLNNNKLGLKHASTDPADNPLPELPPSIKHIHLSNNMLLKVPRAICSPSLTKLEKLDLSRNSLVVIPSELCSLPSLVELNLDHNKIASLPANIGNLKLLKALSLRNNQLRVTSTHFTNKHPQPLPKSLFTNTLLIDLNLHGNSLTNTQMNDFEGFQEFLDRRQKVKSKTLTNLDVCGLD
jgi:Leucine-rich repeat (LRR) protein